MVLSNDAGGEKGETFVAVDSSASLTGAYYDEELLIQSGPPFWPIGDYEGEPTESLLEKARRFDGKYGGQCVTFVKTLLGIRDSEFFNGYAGNIKPNIGRPHIGTVILLDYDIDHAAVIVDIDHVRGVFVLAESNYSAHERVSVGREIPFEDPAIRGFYSFAKEYVVRYAEEYGNDVAKTLSVVSCESGGFDPMAQNASSSAAGLYQFTSDTWSSAVLGFARSRGIVLDTFLPRRDYVGKWNAMIGAYYVAESGRGWQPWECT